MLTLLLVALVSGQVKIRDEGLTKGTATAIDCVGSGITCTAVSGTGTITVTAGGSSDGGAGGIPATIPAVTYSATADLSAERVLSNGNYTVIDNGTAAQSQVDWAHGLTCTSGQALTSSGTTAMACTSTLTASDVACAGTCIADGEIAGVSGSKVSGNVASAFAADASITAVSLAADPAACAAGEYVKDINASGVLSCSAVGASQLSGTVDLATQVSGNLAVARLNSGTSASASTYWSGAGTWTTPAGTYSLPDSTSGTTGGIRLTADLGGTATSPAVVDDSHAHTGTTISALDTADITTGTLPAARGGLGQAQPTCTAGQFLTCNGTTCSCVTHAKVVTSNVTNSTVTPANITGLSWALAANTEYGFNCTITHSGTATGGVRFNLNGPGSPTTVSFVTERYTTTALQTLLVLQAFSAAAQTAACTSSCNTTVLVTKIQGTILNGANVGTAQLMLTSSTAGQLTTVFRGSFCVVY